MDQEILHKYIAGEATQQEKEEVAHWLDADQKNMKEFLAQRKLYDISIWQQESVPLSETNHPIRKRQGTLRTIAIELSKMAAIFILACTAIHLYLTVTDETEEPSMQTLFVPPGQRAELTLTDGTRVWLNAKTTFTFPNQFMAHNRHVILDGEGYFEVTKDTEKPFTVQTQLHNITVLGTEFNVTAYSGTSTFETSLLKGAVEVSAIHENTKIKLEPYTRVYQEKGILKKDTITDTDHFLWKAGLICFNDEPVRSLIEKLQLYYDIKINVLNDDLLKSRYTGKFRTKDGVEHVLKVLQLNHKFTYEKDSESNLITIN